MGEILLTWLRLSPLRNEHQCIGLGTLATPKLGSSLFSLVPTTWGSSGPQHEVYFKEVKVSSPARTSKRTSWPYFSGVRTGPVSVFCSDRRGWHRDPLEGERWGRVCTSPDTSGLLLDDPVVQSRDVYETHPSFGRYWLFRRGLRVPGESRGLPWFRNHDPCLTQSVWSQRHLQFGLKPLPSVSPPTPSLTSTFLKIHK